MVPGSHVTSISAEANHAKPVDIGGAPSSAPQVSPAAQWLTSFGSRNSNSRRGGEMADYLRRASSVRTKPLSHEARDRHLRSYSLHASSTETVQADAEGFVFGDERRYRLGKTLGWGGMSVVREAYCGVTVVAVKLQCHKEKSAANKHEYDLWRQLPAHDNILPLLSTYSLDRVQTLTCGIADVTYLVTPLCSDGNLLSYVRRRGSLNITDQPDSSGVPFDDARNVLLQLTSALHCLHDAGIVHCDIKLENVLGDDTGNGMRWRIADFGLARCVSNDASTDDPLIFGGTLEYTPPEIVQMLEVDTYPLDNLPSHRPRVIPTMYPQASPYARDMWALGCILYALMSGTLPFTGALQSRLQMDIIRAEYEVPPRLIPSDDDDDDDALGDSYVFEDGLSQCSFDTAQQPSKSFASIDSELNDDDFGRDRRLIRETLSSLLEPDAENRWDINALATSEWLSM